MFFIYFIYSFNIKMISRTPRRAEDQTSHHEPHRKFGNIVNRLQKTSQFVPSKCEPNDRYLNTQNMRPHMASYSRQQKAPYIETDRSNIYKLQQSPQHTAPIPSTEVHKKQPINRNRQFVAKVENINKMHDQINSMLKYIKNGQSKSVIKSKDSPQTYSDSIQNMIKERMREHKEPRELKDKGSYQQISANRSRAEYEVNQITPITQQQITVHRVSINGGQRPPRRAEIQENQRERAKINYSQNYRKPTNNYLDPKAIQRSAQELVNNIKQTSKLKFNYDETAEKQKKQKLFDYRQIYNQNPSPRKNPQKVYTPKKNLDMTPKKQTYNYNFSSKEDPEQMLNYRKPIHVQTRDQKINHRDFDYDQEISKVKERIQSSEQMTKKMEQKYLGSHRKSTNNQLRSQLSSKFQIQQSIVTKTFENVNAKQRSYLERNFRPNQEINKTNKTRDFQLKIYPCNNNVIQNDKLRKDEACKLIAEKLSDQIKLDQKLRDARQTFNECRTADKWKILQEKLSKQGYSFSQQELQTQLAISSSQSNPFSTDSSNSSNSIHELAQAFAKSQQFWQRNLRKFISRQSLQKSGFNAKQMDLDQRGYLSVEDLVCFINLHSSNFFRNRDIICLFRRMVALGKNRNGIEYETFLSIISR